jgi:drug/metabolite transporter (DMT)-like permease
MRQWDEWTTGAAILTMAGVFIFPLYLIQDIPPFTTELTLVILCALPLEILGYYLFLSAINRGPISVTIPLLAFTPVFTIASSALLLGERVSPEGAMGILMVTAGAYVLNLNTARSGILKPIKALLESPAARRMLMTAMIWSITSALGRKGALMHGAVPFGFTIEMLIAMCFLIIALVRSRLGLSRIEPKGAHWLLFPVAALFMAGAQLTHFIALSLAPTPYMISVKRLSLVFGVIVGWLFFREREIRFRLAGTLLMVSGVWFIYLFASP